MVCYADNLYRHGQTFSSCGTAANPSGCLTLLSMESNGVSGRRLERRYPVHYGMPEHFVELTA